jgi:hypothetical protein
LLPRIETQFAGMPVSRRKIVRRSGPYVDVSSFGETREEALKSLREVVELYSKMRM